jgi:hypothetical protein
MFGTSSRPSATACSTRVTCWRASIASGNQLAGVPNCGTRTPVASKQPHGGRGRTRYLIDAFARRTSSLSGLPSTQASLCYAQ